MNEQEDNDHAPLWKYVTRLDKAASGGNTSFKCNYCQAICKGSYTRVKAHLLKISGQGVKTCNKVKVEHLNEMRKIVNEAELRLKASSTVPLSSSVSNMNTNKKRKGTFDNPIEEAYNLDARQELNSIIAKMFYSGGLPFHLARNPYYVEAFQKVTSSSKTLSGYIPPGYNLLRTTLLQQERAHIERKLESIKTTWKNQGVSIVSDGWTDAQRRPLINFMAVSESGPMFLNAVNCEGEYKDKYFISNLIKKTIHEVGSLNVVQIITNNAPVCKSAGLLIETQFPHIFWTPCVVHTLNLALKNICAPRNSDANAETFAECNWIKDVVSEAIMIKNFIMNHSMRLSMFNEHVELKFLSVAETRFASNFVMLKRFKDIKQGLQNMVIGSRWSSYKEDDTKKALSVKEKVLNDTWWDNIDYIIEFIEPIYSMLRKTDTDMPCLHMVYDFWDTMIHQVKKVIYRHEHKQENEDSDFYTVVHRILVDRWYKSNTPLHCLAHSLNPWYYSQEWLQKYPYRIAPHKDMEISKQRQKCFERYFPNTDERREVNTEFAKFSAGIREYGNADSLMDKGKMEPDLWWITHGSHAPLLHNLAMKLFAQPCSSSCCERNWSTYSFVNSLKRNKITPQRGEDLVFVHSNLRLLSRKTPQYNKGEMKMWDIGGDAFDSMEGVGILEIANLSLDEPEFESTILNGGTDVGHVVDEPVVHGNEDEVQEV